jgi:alkylated DNA repair dioxygenase AlkB
MTLDASRWLNLRFVAMDDLFDIPVSVAPGFRYEPNLVSEAAQIALIKEITNLPLQAFDFHGFKANRRVISYGWRYNFSSQRLVQIDAIPKWANAVAPTRRPVRRLQRGGFPSGFPKEQEYALGAGMSWHKDEAIYGGVVGVPLAAACALRLRKARGDGELEACRAGGHARLHVSAFRATL